MGRGKRSQRGLSSAASVGFATRADDALVDLSDGGSRHRPLPPQLVKSFAENRLPRPSSAPEPPAPPAGGRPGSLIGKSYVITGKIPNFTRDQAIAALADLGAAVYDQPNKISPGLTALIEGGVPASKKAKGGTKKQQMAQSYGIPVLDENDFYQLIGRTYP